MDPDRFARMMPESARLTLARTVAAELRLREGKNVVAVGVYGSVGRGEERRRSDVDLLVVVRRKRPRIRHTFREGTLVTILQQTPEEARAEVTGDRADINDALGGWRSMRPLYDPSHLLRKLRARAEKPPPAQFRAAAQRGLLEAFEDLSKLWDAIDAGDRDEAREMAIWFSGAAMGVLLDLHLRVLKTGRRAFVEIRRYGAVGEAVRRLRYEPLSLANACRISEFVWRELLALAKRQDLRVPPFPRDSRGRL